MSILDPAHWARLAADVEARHTFMPERCSFLMDGDDWEKRVIFASTPEAALQHKAMRELAERCRSMYNQGMKDTEIAKKLGVRQQRVSDLLWKFGVKGSHVEAH